MTPLSIDQTGAQYRDSTPISTGRLPAAEQVQRLVEAAYERFRSNDSGRNAQHYPALAAVPRQLFGVCVAAIDGAIYAAGNSVKGQLATGFLSTRLGLNLFASKPAERAREGQL